MLEIQLSIVCVLSMHSPQFSPQHRKEQNKKEIYSSDILTKSTKSFDSGVIGENKILPLIIILEKSRIESINLKPKFK